MAPGAGLGAEGRGRLTPPDWPIVARKRFDGAPRLASRDWNQRDQSGDCGSSLATRMTLGSLRSGSNLAMRQTSAPCSQANAVDAGSSNQVAAGTSPVWETVLGALDDLGVVP